MEKQKVFIVGTEKTGTSSMAYALYILGYRIAGEPLLGFKNSSIRGMNAADSRKTVWNHAATLIPDFDVFQDAPWFVFFREMDEAYPGSKFILTTRPTDKWINSVVNHFRTNRHVHRSWIYGVPYPKGYEDAYIQTYEKHIRDVKAYFKDRPDDLLVLDLSTGLTWDAVCPFLGESEPPFGFPKQNSASARSGGMARIKRIARRWFQKATFQKIDGTVIREFWDDKLVALRLFERSITEMLSEQGELSPDSYRVLESTLMDAYTQTNKLKRFLDIIIVPREWPAIDSAEAFHTVWPMISLDFRQLFGDIGEFDVQRIWPETGKTVVESANDIMIGLEDGLKKISA